MDTSTCSPSSVDIMPRMLIQQPFCRVYTTSFLRTRRRPPSRYPRKRLERRVYPKDQNVLTKPATMPNSVRYSETAGPFCTYGGVSQAGSAVDLRLDAYL